MRRIREDHRPSDDMLIIRGVNVFPSQIEELILKCPGLAPHYEIEITRPHRLDEVRVTVEARPELPRTSMMPKPDFLHTNSSRSSAFRRTFKCRTAARFSARRARRPASPTAGDRSRSSVTLRHGVGSRTASRSARSAVHAMGSMRVRPGTAARLDLRAVRCARGARSDRIRRPACERRVRAIARHTAAAEIADSHDQHRQGKGLAEGHDAARRQGRGGGLLCNGSPASAMAVRAAERRRAGCRNRSAAAPRRQSEASAARCTNW